ncbi:NADP-dependent malic enzyme [bacterium]|nr:NADP-dependent malic enzyme [bacterium]
MESKIIRRQEALEYHSIGRKGKIEVTSTKPCKTQRDLSMAYTPGVAEPCLEIVKDPQNAYEYTAKGNLVAVVSNGTAVLGLGNIGALAGKPVMEGKGVLFKRFADVDVFDIELNTEDPDEIIKACKLLEPTFGGINLEDIKAPECFYIEEKLIAELSIPVFHDDQHGTAIISGAGLLNAIKIANKKIEDVKVVFNGAGAAGIACAAFYVSLGVRLENVLLCDSKGVIYKGRTAGMNPYKARFAVETDARTLADAMKGADVFCGVSVKDCVTKDMLRSMADNPIVFAMANPDPEISYPDAIEARDDVIMATGRSDYPNQVNNVLGFPFIFRGALDVQASKINEEMKRAAAYALSELAMQDVPDSVCRAYGVEKLQFGREYIIPKPFDPRVFLKEAPAVARAAVETGVARKPITDWGAYVEELERKLFPGREIVRRIINKAKSKPKRIVFPEGGNEKIIRAAQIIIDEEIGIPILLGNPELIKTRSKKLALDLKGAEIIDPETFPKQETYIEAFWKIRQRKGITRRDARNLLLQRNYLGPMMVQMGDADALVAGVAQHYPETLRPALQIVKTREGIQKVCGIYMMIFKDRVVFFADTTVNIDPTAEDLVEITECTAELVKSLDFEPRIALLSFSNFGSVHHPQVTKVQEAVRMLKQKHPDMCIDGEMQADTAVVSSLLHERYPFSQLNDKEFVNVLIFPELSSGNIAYKLLQRLGGAEAVGPILVGTEKCIHVLQYGAEVSEIVDIAAIAVVDAQ